MIWRKELKYQISGAERAMVIARLSAALERDPYAMPDGTYRVRSLYFDDPFDSAMYASLAGNPEREKYRLRMYNMDPGFLRLEKKIKRYGGGRKPDALLTPEECRRLIAGDYAFLAEKQEPFLQAAYAAARSGGLRPRSVVDYTRAAFCAAGNEIRVTVDSDVRVSTRADAFFDRTLTGTPVSEQGTCILEIKFNDYLPAYLPALIGITDRPLTATSKFAAGRINY